LQFSDKHEQKHFELSTERQFFAINRLEIYVVQHLISSFLSHQQAEYRLLSEDATLLYKINTWLH
jgi:hypothetical protein